MDRIIIYHGSDRTIEKPIFGKRSANSDYGDAFYCTSELYAAKEWANRKTSRGIVNKYYFDARGLKVLDLTDETKYTPLDWFAILIHNRKLDPSFVLRHPKELKFLEMEYYQKLNVLDYDVIIGYRADDAYFRFPLLVIDSQIRIDRLNDLIKNGFLGKQIAIVSEKAFSRLSFIESFEVEPVYQQKYLTRINIANNKLEDILIDERYRSGARMIDLVKDYD